MNLILDEKDDSVFSFLSPLGQRNERNQTKKEVKDCAIHHQCCGMDFVYNWWNYGMMNRTGAERRERSPDM